MKKKGTRRVDTSPAVCLAWKEFDYCDVLRPRQRFIKRRYYINHAKNINRTLQFRIRWRQVARRVISKPTNVTDSSKNNLQVVWISRLYKNLINWWRLFEISSVSNDVSGSGEHFALLPTSLAVNTIIFCKQ